MIHFGILLTYCPFQTGNQSPSSASFSGSGYLSPSLRPRCVVAGAISHRLHPAHLFRIFAARIFVRISTYCMAVLSKPLLLQLATTWSCYLFLVGSNEISLGLHRGPGLSAHSRAYKTTCVLLCICSFDAGAGVSTPPRRRSTDGQLELQVCFGLDLCFQHL